MKYKYYNDSAATRMFNEALEASGKSQVHVADKVGVTANVITMFKQGRSRIPVNRAEALARVVGMPVKPFVMLVFAENCPEEYRALDKLKLFPRGY